TPGLDTVLVSAWWSGLNVDLDAGDLPGSMTLSFTRDGTTSILAGHEEVAAGATGTRTATGSSGLHASWALVFNANQPPHAPIVTSPATGQTWARNEPNTVAATFSDPDPGDSPSRMVGQVRLAGETEPYYSWDVESPNTTHVIPANELTLGD